MTKRKNTDIKNFTVVVYRTTLKRNALHFLSLRGVALSFLTA